MAGGSRRTPKGWGPQHVDEVRRAQAGCDHAFRSLYERLAGDVRGAAWRILGDDHATDDMVQETFLTAYSRLHTLDDLRAFDAWVLRIARNKSVTEARRRARCRPSPCAHDESVDGPGGVRVMRRSGAAEPRPDAIARIDEALERLSPTLRRTFELRYERGLSYDEISRRLGIRIGAVKTRLCRARALVRDALSVSRE